MSYNNTISILSKILKNFKSINYSPDGYITVLYEKDRKNLDINVMGVKAYKLEDFAMASINFEFNTNNNIVLITGEIACKDNEIPFIEKYIIKIGGYISAIHNHWIL